MADAHTLVITVEASGDVTPAPQQPEPEDTEPTTNDEELNTDG